MSDYILQFMYIESLIPALMSNKVTLILCINFGDGSSHTQRRNIVRILHENFLNICHEKALKMFSITVTSHKDHNVSISSHSIDQQLDQAYTTKSALLTVCGGGGGSTGKQWIPWDSSWQGDWHIDIFIYHKDKVTPSWWWFKMVYWRWCL